MPGLHRNTFEVDAARDKTRRDRRDFEQPQSRCQVIGYVNRRARCVFGDRACRLDPSTGSNASAPFIVVALTNAGPRCQLSDYPHITAYTSTSTSSVSVAVHHGTYEIPDGGPRYIIVEHGRAATFAVGTSTGFGGGIVLITRLDIQLPTNDPGSLTPHIPGGLGTTAPEGHAVPVGITAFAAE